MDIAALASAFAAGALSFFSPCVIPLLPVYVGLLTVSSSSETAGFGRRIANALAFVLGISVVFALMGAGAGLAGSFITSPAVVVAFGVIVLVFGLHMSGLISIPLLNREKKVSASKVKNRFRGVFGSFLLGLAFSFGWTPCIGPVLGAILALAATQGSAVQGAVLLIAYSAGMSIPFVVIAVFSEALLAKVKALRSHLPVIKKIGGALIAVMGLWMIFAQSGLVSSLQVNSTFGDSKASSSASQDSSDDLTRWKDIELSDLDGNIHTLSEYDGKPLYFEFWGTWCPICMETLDQFAEEAKEHNQKGDVQVVSVVVPGMYGELNRDDFVEYAKEEGLDFPILLDDDAQLVEYFAVGGFPTSVFIDGQNHVVDVRAGAIAKEDLDKILSDLK